MLTKVVVSLILLVAAAASPIDSEKCGASNGARGSSMLQRLDVNAPDKYEAQRKPEVGHEAISNKLAMRILGSEDSSSLTFSVHEGYISDGGDLLRANMTVYAAMRKCRELKGRCKGFSHVGTQEDGVNGIVEVFFKDKWDNIANAWTSFKLESKKDADAPEYSKHTGYIANGHDLLQGTMTIEDAKRTCYQLKNVCAGFTFNGKASEKEHLEMFFKTKWVIEVPRIWTSYKEEDFAEMEQNETKAMEKLEKEKAAKKMKRKQELENGRIARGAEEDGEENEALDESDIMEFQGNKRNRSDGHPILDATKTGKEDDQNILEVKSANEGEEGKIEDDQNTLGVKSANEGEEGKILDVTLENEGGEKILDVKPESAVEGKRLDAKPSDDKRVLDVNSHKFDQEQKSKELSKPEQSVSQRSRMEGEDRKENKRRKDEPVLESKGIGSDGEKILDVQKSKTEGEEKLPEAEKLGRLDHDVAQHDVSQSFSEHNGFISVGGDLMSDIMTVSQAMRKCRELKTCRGFTHEGAHTEDAVEIFFKDKWDNELPLQWTSYKVETKDGQKYFSQHEGFIPENGNRVLLRKNMTVAEAKKKCLNLDKCAGFTYLAPSTSDVVEAFLKEKWSLQVQGKWTSYKFEGVKVPEDAALPSHEAPDRAGQNQSEAAENDSTEGFAEANNAESDVREDASNGVDQERNTVARANDNAQEEKSPVAGTSNSDMLAGSRTEANEAESDAHEDDHAEKETVNGAGNDVQMDASNEAGKEHSTPPHTKDDSQQDKESVAALPAATASKSDVPAESHAEASDAENGVRKIASKDAERESSPSSHTKGDAQKDKRPVAAISEARMPIEGHAATNKAENDTHKDASHDTRQEKAGDAEAKSDGFFARMFR